MSYQKVKAALRRQVILEYNTYRSLCSPYPNKERGVAWNRHELTNDVYTAVCKSHSKSYGAALKICTEFVKSYKHKCKAYQATTEKCLAICKGAV